MAEKLSLADKQYLAKILYTREKLDGKMIAKRVNVSENTVSSWVNKFGWKNLRNRLLVGKEEILTHMYEELEELQTHIRGKEKGKQYSDNKEADIKIKLTASIRNLETELAIADLVESGIRFIKFLQTRGTLKQTMEVAELWNSFLQESIKR